MRLDFIGGGVGLIIGFGLGAGPFGLIGGAVGAVVGLLAGGGLARALLASHVEAITATPHAMGCPHTGKDVKVSLDGEETTWAMYPSMPAKVGDCSLWPEREDCDQACMKDKPF